MLHMPHCCPFAIAPSPADPSAPHILVGSHYDTVHDGGKYDGALGIIAGIAAVKALLVEVGRNMAASVRKQEAGCPLLAAV